MLEAVKLTKRYGETHALNQLDLKIEAGELFCLLGPNGAGKTTTVKLFLGFIEATSGQAMVNNRPAHSRGADRIAYIPENLLLYPTLSGYENLRFFSRMAGHRLERSELENYLNKAGLQAESFDRKAKTYSKGMRQKVGIAIALAQRAAALILDEPTSGLDPKAAHEFSVALRELRNSGSCILMTTHDLFRAKEVADRIGIMANGKLQTIIDPKIVSHLELERAYLEVS